MNKAIKKPSSVVNFIQEGFYRPLSCLPSAIFVYLGITANTVTLTRLIIFFTSLFLMFTAGTIGDIYLAIGLYFFSEVLDFSDGSVARYTKKSSGFGAFLDGYTDFYNNFYLLAIPSIMNVMNKNIISHNAQLYFFIFATLVVLSHNFFTVRLGLTVRLIRQKNNSELDSFEKAREISGKGLKLMPIYASFQSLGSLIFIASVLFQNFYLLVAYILVFKVIMLNLEILIQIRRYKKFLEAGVI